MHNLFLWDPQRNTYEKKYARGVKSLAALLYIIQSEGEKFEDHLPYATGVISFTDEEVFVNVGTWQLLYWNEKLERYDPGPDLGPQTIPLFHQEIEPA